jgi:hypothetical protein
MRVQFLSRIAEETVFIEVDVDGRLVLTHNFPLRSEFEQIDEWFDYESDEERVAWIPGLVLPYGYVAVGVFKGGLLQRIFLAGRGIKLTCFNLAEMHSAITANEKRITEELGGFGK